jgi:hypothetical protein
VFTLLSFLLIVATGIFSLLPYLNGLRLQPPGTIYLGTVHYPPDYFYYLSQMVQGERKWIFTDYIWGSEPLRPSLIGWLYVFVGRIFHLLHIPQITGYEIYMAIIALLFAGVAYLLLTRMFPKQKAKTFVSLLFFLISAPFFTIVKTATGWTLAYTRQWYNFGDPFNRLDPTPSHNLNMASVMIGFLVMSIYWNTKNTKKYFLIIPLLFAAVNLATSQPVQLGELCMTLGIVAIIRHLKISRAGIKLSISKIIVDGFPLIIMAIVSVPPMIHLSRITSTPPYSIAKAWEASLQVYLPLYTYIGLYGIIPIIGFLSLPLFLLKRNDAKLLVTVYTILVAFFYFSPIPEKTSILNLRFLSSVLLLFFAPSAAEGIFWICGLLKRFKGITICCFVLLICSLVAPPFILELPIRIHAEPTNPIYYLSQDAYKAILKAKEVSNPTETILTFWPFEKIAPGLTGRKTFLYDKNSTIDYDAKSALAYAFIINKMTPEEMYSFLKKYNIRSVVTYADSLTAVPNFLTPVFESKTMKTYVVR